MTAHDDASNNDTTDPARGDAPEDAQHEARDPWASGPESRAAYSDTSLYPTTPAVIPQANGGGTDGTAHSDTVHSDTAHSDTANYGTASYGAYGGPTWAQPSDGGAGSYASVGAPATPPATPQTPAAHPAQPKRLRTALLGTAVAAALIGGAAGAGTVALTDHSHSTVAASSLSSTGSTAPMSAVTNGTVSAAAAKITPSVVTIQVTGASESGTGSGVIVRRDGYILTNNHVVAAAGTTGASGTITVQTSDGRSAKASVVGTDTTDDLAVIKVTGLTDLTAATFAKSSSLTVGQGVVAIGAPLGLTDTVTSGIVSATARTVRSGENNDAVFAAVQTDAAINPGNSGGALVDLNGNVIGINSAIASTVSSSAQGQPTTQPGSIGIGFAIPSDEASRVANELINTGKAGHAVLGVGVASSAASSATSISNGAVLRSVTSGGSAASAGLAAGDVVTRVDNLRVSDGDDLIAAIRAHAVKDKVTITYTRAGASHTVTVTLSSATS